MNTDMIGKIPCKDCDVRRRYFPAWGGAAAKTMPPSWLPVKRLTRIVTYRHLFRMEQA